MALKPLKPSSDVLLQAFPLDVRRSILRRAHCALPVRWQLFPFAMVVSPITIVLVGMAIDDMRWQLGAIALACVLGFFFYRMHRRYEETLADLVASIIQQEAPCPQCGYSLRGLLDGRDIDCPECGMSLLADSDAAATKAESNDYSCEVQ